jgi:predicted acyltransferase
LVGLSGGLWGGAGAPPLRTGLVLAGVGLVAAGAGLAWGRVFPINKNLWTSSYALFSAGAAAVALAACHWLVDVRGWTKWSRPFVVLGVNAITLFVASGLLTKSLIAITLARPDGRRVTLYHSLFVTLYEPWLSPHNASLLFAGTHLVLLYGLCALLYRRQIFLRA